MLEISPTPGVDFINVFTANFYARGAQKRKKSCSFTKTNFIKLLRTAFAPSALRQSPVGVRQKKHRKLNLLNFLYVG